MTEKETEIHKMELLDLEIRLKEKYVELQQKYGALQDAHIQLLKDFLSLQNKPN